MGLVNEQQWRNWAAPGLGASPLPALPLPLLPLPPPLLLALQGTTRILLLGVAEGLKHCPLHAAWCIAARLGWEIDIGGGCGQQGRGASLYLLESTIAGESDVGFSGRRQQGARRLA